MSELLALGVSHKTAPLAVRERLALTEGTTEPFVRDLVALPEISEAVAISTCNRTELYLVVADPVEAESALLGRLARAAGIRPTELATSIYSLRNCDAARHLFRVTAGLDSMIIGEAEVMGQVRRAYDTARAAEATGPLTHKLFQAALATGGRVRSETRIGEGAASIASVAVDAARRRLGDLREKRVLIVGAGETSELCARALSVHGVSTLFVANRRHDRARALADRFGGMVASFDRLPDEMLRCDIALFATSAPHPIVGAEELDEVMGARGGRELLLLDIAVPRDVDPACGLIDDVTLYDVDALHAQLRANQLGRDSEVGHAMAIVEEEISIFAGWLGSLEVLPTVAALRKYGQEVAAAVLAENAGRWESASDKDMERVEALTRALVNRLLHEPTVRMKRMGADRRHARMQVVRELFGLEGEPAAEPDAPQQPAAEVTPLRRPA